MNKMKFCGIVKCVKSANQDVFTPGVEYKVEDGLLHGNLGYSASKLEQDYDYADIDDLNANQIRYGNFFKHVNDAVSHTKYSQI